MSGHEVESIELSDAVPFKIWVAERVQDGTMTEGGARYFLRHAKKNGFEFCLIRHGRKIYVIRPRAKNWFLAGIEAV